MYDNAPRGRAPPLFGSHSRRSARVVHALRRLTVAVAAAIIVSALVWWVLWSTGRVGEQTRHYDAIIIPGGGLDELGRPTAWVAERLEAALRHDAEASFFLVLSRGTTHRPAPRDAAGYAIDEAAASAKYLIDRGINPSRVLLESWSLDTIGNAAFARIMHSELRGWRRCLVITSALHMPRTRAIFEWIFALPPHRKRPPQLDYEAVGDEATGVITPAASAARRAKEEVALAKLRETTIGAVGSLAELHAFLFASHAAYSAAGRAQPHTAAEARGDLLKTY